MLDSALSSALRGLSINTALAEKAAGNIAQTGAAGAGNSTANLVQDVVDLKQAQIGFSANIKVAEVAKDMQQRLLDILV